MLKKTLVLTLTICLGVSCDSDMSGPSSSQFSEFKLTASDAASDHRFGSTVSISGDYAIVGAINADGFFVGSAYIFVFDGQGWTEQAKLTARLAAESDMFGISVSIGSNYAIVGAWRDDDNGFNSGSAYTFVRNGQSRAKLTASDAAAGDQFGLSVSISGDYAIVGATETFIPSDSGSAYIFVFDGQGWIEQAKLTASDAAAGDQFGISVSISGDYAIIGAYNDDDGGDASGSAYIFVRDGQGWTERAKLTASDAAAGDEFGLSVSISGDYAIIGAFGDDDDGSSSGSAYIFVRDGQSWTEQAKLTASDAAAGDGFGSVSISGDYAVVGARLDDDNGTDSGSAYIFVRDGQSWTERAKLTASDAAGNDKFGISVSISGDYAIVGAWGDDHAGFSSGSAYVYSGITSL